MLYVNSLKQLCDFLVCSLYHYKKTDDTALVPFPQVLTHFGLCWSCARVPVPGYLLIQKARSVCKC